MTEAGGAEYSMHQWRCMVERTLHAHKEDLAGLPVSDVLFVCWHFGHTISNDDDGCGYSVTPRRGVKAKKVMEHPPLAELPGITPVRVSRALKLAIGLGLIVETGDHNDEGLVEYAPNWLPNEALEVEGGWDVAELLGIKRGARSRDMSKAVSYRESKIRSQGGATSPQSRGVQRPDSAGVQRPDSAGVQRPDSAPLPIGVLDNRGTQCGPTSPGTRVADPVEQKSIPSPSPGPLTEAANDAARPLGLAGRRKPHTPPPRRSWAVCPDCSINRRTHDDEGRCIDCHDRHARRTA